ncbi:FxsA family protein [Leminorella grimontii]|uniref:FxsA family protein n=1 Tax=Leminorella grimontii TaxID=82981 RepID=UPI002087503B|nr:FxsA family protein [Leminorella grimontii]GKX61218.1 membrane protein FxsA [Leminorella grimontii]
MRWFPLILLFLLVYIEITLFIKVSDVFGVALTLILIIATSCLGVSMVRQQGLRTLIQMQTKLAQGENPAAEMVKSVSLFIAGFLLLIPGFFTDFLGLLLLLPPVQKLLTLRMMPYIHVFRPPSGFSAGDAGAGSQGGYTVEGEFERKNDESDRRIDDKNDK